MPKTAGQRGLAVLVLIVILIAVGWVAVPFKDGRSSCDPAVWSAFHEKSTVLVAAVPPIPAHPAAPKTGNTLLDLLGQATAAVPGSPAIVRFSCQTPARNRAATSGVVIGLAAVAFIVGRRILAPPSGYGESHE